MTREQNPQESEIVSSIFQNQYTVTQISAQRMRKLAKIESVFLAVVRIMNEERRNESTVTVNDDKTTTPYPMQVQAISDKLQMVFPKTYQVDCHHLVNCTTELSWYPELNHPTGPPTECRRRGWTN